MREYSLQRTMHDFSDEALGCQAHQAHTAKQSRTGADQRRHFAPSPQAHLQPGVLAVLTALLHQVPRELIGDQDRLLIEGLQQRIGASREAHLLFATLCSQHKTPAKPCPNPRRVTQISRAGFAPLAGSYACR